MSMIETIYANGHLPELLDRVASGETITLTEKGQPVAQIVPAPAPQKSPGEIAEVVRKMLEFRDMRGPTLGDDLTIRDLIEEGRR